MEYVQAFKEEGYQVLVLCSGFIAEQQVYKIHQVTTFLNPD